MVLTWTGMAYAYASEQEAVEMLAQNSSRPMHGHVYAYNMNVSLARSPPEISTYSRGAIRSAWVAILDVEPLVEDLWANTTWVPLEGEIRIAYGYDYRIPPDEPGCGSTYSLDSKGVDFEAYALAGGERQRLHVHGGLANYSLPPPAQPRLPVIFTVTATFWVKYTEHRHSLDCDCSTDAEGNTDCDCWCEYEGSVAYEDRLPVNDSKTYSLYHPTVHQMLLIDHPSQGFMQGRFYFNSSQPVDGLLLSLGRSLFSLDIYDYYVVPGGLGIKKIRAEATDAVKHVTGIFSDISAGPQGASFYWTAENAEPARLTVLTHFDEIEISLDPVFTISTALELQTAWSYSSGSEIKALAVLRDEKGSPLPGKRILFDYAGETRATVTDAAGTAIAAFAPVPGENVLAAWFPGDYIYGESHNIAHFFTGRYTPWIIAYVTVAAVISYYLTIKLVKMGLGLMGRGRRGI